MDKSKITYEKTKSLRSELKYELRTICLKTNKICTFLSFFCVNSNRTYLTCKWLLGEKNVLDTGIRTGCYFHSLQTSIKSSEMTDSILN